MGADKHDKSDRKEGTRSPRSRSNSIHSRSPTKSPSRSRSRGKSPGRRESRREDRDHSRDGKRDEKKDDAVKNGGSTRGGDVEMKDHEPNGTKKAIPTTELAQDWDQGISRRDMKAFSKEGEGI